MASLRGVMAKSTKCVLASFLYLSNQGFSRRSRGLLEYDLRRFVVRRRRRRDTNIQPLKVRLHVGCGPNRVEGWLNVDLTNSDYDLDLAGGRLPWGSAVFEAIVGEHVVEHLELEDEVIPLLKEMRRILKPGGEIWLSTPDISKICRSYIQHRMSDLLEDRKNRWPDYSIGEKPTSYFINELFHQHGEHKNLFDFELLKWACRQAGIVDVKCETEADLLKRFPGFPPRNDDLQAIYVLARVP